MALPTVSLPRPDHSVEPSSGGGGQQQSATVVISPLSAHQAIFMTDHKFPFSPQQLENAEKLARDLGIPFSVGRGETTEEADWIGGADGVLQFFYRRKSLPKPIQMYGFRVSFPPDTAILYKDD